MQDSNFDHLSAIETTFKFNNLNFVVSRQPT